jgi:hypothetical protein
MSRVEIVDWDRRHPACRLRAQRCKRRGDLTRKRVKLFLVKLRAEFHPLAAGKIPAHPAMLHHAGLKYLQSDFHFLRSA